MRGLIVIGWVCVLAAFATAEQIKCPAPVTHLSVPKGEYSPLQGVTFVLQNFSADMVSRGKTSPFCFMRITDIEQGQVFIDVQSLRREFSSKLQQSESQIEDLNIETRQDAAQMKGKIKKLIPIPFTLEGPVTTDGTRLLFHVKSVKAIGIPVKGLLEMLGKHLDTIFQSESVGGVAVQNDTIIFEPEKIAHVRGKIVAARVAPNGLFVSFSGPEAKKRPPKP